MFDTFTIRTKPYETSPFKSDSHFSLLKMLSLDPLRSLNAEEFFVWIFLTLTLCCIYSAYSLLKGVLRKRILRTNRNTVIKEEQAKGARIEV